MDGSIQLLNNWGLASVVQRLDSAIHQAQVVQTLDSAIRRINNYPADNYYYYFLNDVFVKRAIVNCSL